MRDFIKKHKKDIIFCLVIFFLAFQIRILYINNAIALHSVRGDSAKYTSIAFNLKYHDAYSQEESQLHYTPTSQSNLSIGYPIFLTPFVNEDLAKFEDYKTPWENGEAYKDLLTVQALLGALTVLLIFIISRQFFGFGWSALPSALTTFNPHLIMLSGCILTETLFIFVMTLGLLTLLLSWKYNKLILIFVASILLSLSFEIRTIAIGLPLILGIVFLINTNKKNKFWSINKSSIAKVCIVILGVITVIVSASIFKQFYTKNLETNEETTKTYEEVINLDYKIKNILTPSSYYIEKIKNGKKAYFVKGYTQESFKDQPMAYIKWNLGGKLIEMWEINSPYQQEIYLFPMIKRPFHNNGPIILKFIYNAMSILHWPLFLLTWVGLVLYLNRLFRRRLKKHEYYILIPLLTFIYLIGTIYLTTAGSVSRYTIPARPVSYILAMIPLILLIKNKKTLWLASH